MNLDSGHAVDALTDLNHPIKTDTARWAKNHLINNQILDDDAQCRFWSEGWALAAERGLTGLMVTEEFGGRGLDLISTLLHLEGVGYGSNDAGLAYSLATQVLTVQPVLQRFGSVEQKADYLPGLADGSLIGAFSITEADAGSDVLSLATTFVSSHDGDGFVLNGDKVYVTMAPVADMFIVFATSDASLGAWGVSAFVVPADTPGLTVKENRPKMGLRTTPFADLSFSDCVVPGSSLLGSVGSGAAIFTKAMEMERAFILICQLGLMERYLDITAKYASEREQFGSPIAAFQAVGHRLADMKLAHDNSRLQLYRAAILHTKGSPMGLPSATAKLQISEAASASASAAVMTHGAKGYIAEFGVERYFRDVVGSSIYAGTSDIQRNIIASLLGT